MKKAISSKTVLYLNLKREYFADIASGNKRKEWRTRTPYWETRLEGKSYDVINFRNGYGPRVPEMIVEFKGLQRLGKRGTGDYVIVLGRVLSIKRWPPKAAPSARERRAPGKRAIPSIRAELKQRG